MEHRKKRDLPRYDLIAQYEAMDQTGESIYLSERDFHKIINYYEDEFLLEKAVDVAQQAVQQYPYCVDFLLAHARLLLAMDKPYRAMQTLDKAELISPFELDVTLMRARVLSGIGESSQALALLADSEKSTTSQDDLLEIYLCESAICEHARDFDGMFKALSKVLRIDSSNEEALERVWVSVELSKKYKKSIKLHTKLLDENPFLYQAWFNLGHAYSCTGEYAKAIHAIEYSFLINPDFELGYLDCAELCCQEQQFDKALDIYTDMVARFGADSDDLVKIAECQLEVGKVEECEQTLVEAMRMDPYNDEVFYFLGKCFYKQSRFENAQSALIKAVELEDRREEYYSALAKVYAKSGENGKADFYFAKATEIGPEQEYYWLLHCRFLIGLGEFEKALQVIEEADYHTFSAELLYCKAICLFKLDFRKKAIQILSEALVESFNTHTIMFDLCPEFKKDEEIESIIRYYQGEFVQTI